MSKYTTELLNVVYAYSTPGKPLMDRIDEANENYIFDFDYPIWAEEYRQELERKIVLHYIRREIALETVEMWKIYLQMRMLEIMPYYNQVYLTTTAKFDLENDVNILESFGKTLDSTASETGTANATTDQSGTTKSDTLTSDYPQSAVSASASSYYASGAQNNTGETNLNGTDTTTSERQRTGKDTEESTKTRKGLSGLHLPGDLITSYRKTIINIDMQIIGELRSLFMTLY